MGQVWSALSFLVPGENQANIQSEHLDARKLEQDRVISELKSMEPSKTFRTLCIIYIT